MGTLWFHAQLGAYAVPKVPMPGVRVGAYGEDCLFVSVGMIRVPSLAGEVDGPDAWSD